jgi:hypothetical protein
MFRKRFGYSFVIFRKVLDKAVASHIGHVSASDTQWGLVQTRPIGVQQSNSVPNACETTFKHAGHVL